MFILHVFTVFVLSFSQAEEPCNDVATCPPEPIFLEENTKGHPSPMSNEKRERWEQEAAEKPKFSGGSEIAEKHEKNPSGVPRVYRDPKTGDYIPGTGPAPFNQ